MLSKIVVVGSTNTDMVVQSEKFPAAGETVLGGKFFMNPGGKGANQAVAAARLGGNVTFITKTGNDIFGLEAVQNFERTGIDVDYVAFDTENPTGVALITVNNSGENSIVVAPGSNSTLNKEDIDNAIKAISEAELILVQLEIPVETVEYVVNLAAELGKKVILNPAPAQLLSDKLLKNIFLITPNKVEAEALTGIPVTDFESGRRAAEILSQKGVENIIITLGALGACAFSKSGSAIIPAPKVNVVDTTAAGDTFNGALAVALSEGKSIEEAVMFANSAASVSVTRRGAQASVPFRSELELKYQKKQ